MGNFLLRSDNVEKKQFHMEYDGQYVGSISIGNSIDDYN